MGNLQYPNSIRPTSLPGKSGRWKIVYKDIHKHWTLYELAEKLIDLEDYFRSGVSTT